MREIPFGPTGKVVYDRTYSRTKADGTKETWHDTVDRVVAGNLALVHGNDRTQWGQDVLQEADALRGFMREFAIIPAGRHLWASGVEGRQYLFNCHVAGWSDQLSRHFRFTFLRLMEGGGVGSNYSSRHLTQYGNPARTLNLHFVCRPDHPDYEELKPYLSTKFQHDSQEWRGYVEDSREGWADTMAEVLDIYFRDAWLYSDNLIYDLSKIRPSGSPLRTFGGTASGPAPFARMMHTISNTLNSGVFNGVVAMEIDHAIAECVVSGGNRRSARMSIMRWDDPYIFKFIRCKQDSSKHWTTNISVEIDDKFLEGGENAKFVMDMITDSMLKNGEPGIWNSSLSKQGELGDIIATNPCGEIALEAWENCNLGHVNLDYFIKPDGHVNYTQLYEAHRLMSRFLIRATFGDVNDDEQSATLQRNRRIGVGHLGVQGFWAKQGIRYSEIPHASGSRHLLTSLYKHTREAAREYCHQLRIPEPVKVTCVAPTGSIAKLPGVSEGIHPIYARWYERRVRFSLRDAEQARKVMQLEAEGFTVETDVYDESGMTAVVVFPTEDILVSEVSKYGWDEDVVQSAEQLTVYDMLAVQRLYQTYWADNAVSYTVNVPEGSLTVQELSEALTGHLPYLKGTTIMVDASRPQAPYTRITREEYWGSKVQVVEDSTDELCASGACPVRLC